METILVKIFATALALSEVLTQPQAVKTQFDPVRDQAEVVQILRAGCAHMRQAFDIESINVDELIATALDDPKALGADKVFHGINFADLNAAYRRFCKNETVANRVDLGEAITFFNNAAADLPDQTRLKGRKLPSMSVVLDGKGRNFADLFEPATAASGSRSPTFPISSRRRSSPPRTGVSSSITASTSAASSAPSSAISPTRAGRRAARPSPSRS